jgi:hypothetical protein
MFASRKCFVSVTAAVALGAFCAACGAIGETDVEVNAPLLNAAGVNIKETLMGKRAPEPNLQERAPLVMPPTNAALPVPGQSQVASAQNPRWPADSDEAKKLAAKEAAAKHDDYCKNGEWKDEKGNIDTFRKNVNQDDRCRPSWIYRVMHPSEDKKTQ